MLAVGFSLLAHRVKVALSPDSTHGWGLVLVPRLSCGPAEEHFITRLGFIAKHAAAVDVRDEVLFPGFVPLLAWAANCAECMMWGATAYMATACHGS